MLDIHRTSQFKKDIKRAKKSAKPIEVLKSVIIKLANNERLEEKLKDHKLSGEYSDCRECHLLPDWLLIYQVSDKFLTLVRCGSHSDLLL